MAKDDRNAVRRFAAGELLPEFVRNRSRSEVRGLDVKSVGIRVPAPGRRIAKWCLAGIADHFDYHPLCPRALLLQDIAYPGNTIAMRRCKANPRAPIIQIPADRPSVAEKQWTSPCPLDAERAQDVTTIVLYLAGQRGRCFPILPKTHLPRAFYRTSLFIRMLNNV